MTEIQTTYAEEIKRCEQAIQEIVEQYGATNIPPRELGWIKNLNAMIALLQNKIEEENLKNQAERV